MNRNTLTILQIFGLLFFSCKCDQRAQGVVLDKDNKQPINKVIVSTKDITANTIVGQLDSTNELGRFNYDGGFVKGSTKCTDLTLYFFKWGYKMAKRTFSAVSINDTVLLEKTNTFPPGTVK